MSPAADATPGAAPSTQPTSTIDPRPPGIRLMLYRANIADWCAARAMQCDAAWFDLDQAPVRLNARPEQKEPEVEEKKEKEEKEGKEGKEGSPPSPPSPPTPPPGKVALMKARLAARGPSCLRREVLPLEDTPVCRADALPAGGSPLATGGRKAGLYGARRGPATATPRAPTAPPRAPSTKECLAPVAANDAALLPMDIDEEPARIARPMGRALSMHLFGKPPSLRSDGVPAAVEPMEVASPAPEGGLLKRKRGGAEDADAGPPPAKRIACFQTRSRRARCLAPSRRSRASWLDAASNDSTTLYPRQARTRCRTLQGEAKRGVSGASGRWPRGPQPSVRSRRSLRGWRRKLKARRRAERNPMIQACDPFVCIGTMTT